MRRIKHSIQAAIILAFVEYALLMRLPLCKRFNSALIQIVMDVLFFAERILIMEFWLCRISLYKINWNSLEINGDAHKSTNATKFFAFVFNAIIPILPQVTQKSHAASKYFYQTPNTHFCRMSFVMGTSFGIQTCFRYPMWPYYPWPCAPPTRSLHLMLCMTAHLL